MKHSFWGNLIITKIVACLFMVIPLQAMFYRTTSNVAPKRSISLLKYQKAAATQKVLAQRAQIHQHQKIADNKKQKFNFERSSVSSKGSGGALLAALGLGWLWYNSEDEAEQEADEKHISLDQFVKKFAPPKEIQETIEAHKDALAPRFQKPYLIEGTQPPVYHKRNDIDRIINAEILREVIKQNNLDIEIPKKYIYPNPNNGKYQIFVEGVLVRPLGTEQLTLKEIQDLMTLTTESGYTDFNKDNLFRNPQNNKLVIIDTEDASFRHNMSYEYRSKTHSIDWAINKLNREFKVDRNAQAWASDYLKKLKDSEKGREILDLYAPRYNKLNISAANAEELQRELRKQNQGQEAFAAKASWFMKHTVRPRLGL